MIIRFTEWLAGKLMVYSARRRAERGTAEDIHETRHLFSALVHGNSDWCGPGRCRLDDDWGDGHGHAPEDCPDEYGDDPFRDERTGLVG